MRVSPNPTLTRVGESPGAKSSHSLERDSPSIVLGILSYRGEDVDVILRLQSLLSWLKRIFYVLAWNL